MTAGDGRETQNFGSSVSISGTTVIVGAEGVGNRHGAAYLYSHVPTVAVSPIPLPAGVWLLGSALGLIALKRRRV
ncbi:FG-GAP repeat protein [Poseidonocella pacifica]|uniref:FG-GAP repeat protein n=1 Tax=Poseidonocella pacifica TaxID=871651 RepID=UPI002481B6EF|nr:FG-GAP repeat protein [Poseidonocella pacifica]